jgi:hemoglobin
MLRVRVPIPSAMSILLVLTAIAAPAAEQASPVSGAQKTLYERLGGAYPIAVVVDDFIERLLVNDTLNANPAIDEARRRVPKQGLKFHVATLVCQVTGGPCQYTGRDMKASHAHLNITEKEWQAMLTDFLGTLDTFKVPKAEQDELVAIVESTKPDIVVGSAPR